MIIIREQIMVGGFWNGGMSASGMMTETYEPIEAGLTRKNSSGQEPPNPNLRSTHKVTGYSIHVADRIIGHVEDFIFDDTSSRIDCIVVDTVHYFLGKSTHPARFD